MEEKSSHDNSAPLRGLAESIRNAQLLLSYASETGISLPPDIIKSIIEIKHCYTSAILPPDLVEMETRFLQATMVLAKAVSPVTVASLRACYETQDDISLVGRFRTLIWQSSSQISIAALSVRRFRFLASFTLIVLLIVQIYWVIGSSLTADVTKTLEQTKEESIKYAVLTKEQKQLDQRIKVLNSAVRSTGMDQKGASEDRNILQGELDKKIAEAGESDARLQNYYASTAADLSILDYWNGYWRLPAILFNRLVNGKSDEHSKNEDPMQELGKLGKSLKTAKFALHAMQIYLLPILYGILGAFTYVLRTLATQIRDLTYTPEANISFRLRMSLGALSGLVIVWFIKDGNNSQTPFPSLSQFAIAFAAGYSIELLFASMDRFLAAFSSSTRKEK